MREEKSERSFVDRKKPPPQLIVDKKKDHLD